LIFERTRGKVARFLEMEAVMGALLTVLLPVLVIDIGRFGSPDMLQRTIPFLQEIVTGLGTGILLSLMLFRIIRQYEEERWAPIAILMAALLSYVLAEGLGGNGVLSAATLGLFYGNITLHERAMPRRFFGIFTGMVEMIAFMAIGILIDMPYDMDFIIVSIGLFIIYLVMRYGVLSLSYKGRERTSFRQTLFMTLMTPRGMPTVAVLLAFAPAMTAIAPFALAFVMLSLLSTFLASKLSRHLIEADIQA